MALQQVYRSRYVCLSVPSYSEVFALFRSRENIERMYNEDEDEEGCSLCCTRIVLLIAGVVMLGVGVNFYTQATSTDRQQKIIKFDQSVHDWNRTKKAQLEASTFYLTVQIVNSQGDIKSRETSLFADTSSDSAVALVNDQPKSDSETVALYTPLKFDLGVKSGKFLDGIAVNFTESQTAKFIVKVGSCMGLLPTLIR